MNVVYILWDPWRCGTDKEVAAVFIHSPLKGRLKPCSDAAVQVCASQLWLIWPPGVGSSLRQFGVCANYRQHFPTYDPYVINIRYVLVVAMWVYKTKKFRTAIYELLKLRWPWETGYQAPTQTSSDEVLFLGLFTSASLRKGYKWRKKET